jgi:phage gp36-like protein
MTTTNLYCSRDDVIGRLSQEAIDYLLVDSNDPWANEENLTILDDIIRSVSADVEFYLTPYFTTPMSQDDASRNEWLKTRTVDLASHRVCGRCARSVPETIKEAAANAVALLEIIASGDMRVPNLVYPTDGYTLERHANAKPGVVNPGERRSRYWRPRY